jgi:hypothetical protein
MKRFGLIAATLGLAATLSVPAMAEDHWRDGYRLSEHERHEIEKRQERIAREQRRDWERAQRNNFYYNNRYRSGNPYGYGYSAPANGYYDRWGVFHRY